MKYLALYFSLIFLHQQLSAQSIITDIKKKDTLDHIASTPAKSGLSYSALTEFFQSTITTGKNGGFSFKTTLFGLQKLFSSSKSLDLYAYYLGPKGKGARNLEFSFGAYTTTGGQLNTTIAGFKYALINHRNKSDMDFSSIEPITSSLKNINDVLREAEKQYRDNINNEPDASKKRVSHEIFDKILATYNTSQRLSDLPVKMQEDIVERVKKISPDKDTASFFHLAQTQYDEAAKAIDNRALLTLSFNPGYDWIKTRFDTTSFNFQYLIGLSKNHVKPWTFDGQLRGIFQCDSTSTAKNLSRFVSVVSLGINKTLVNDDKKNPLVEFEFAFENDYVHNGLYTKEEQEKLTLNTILRVHLSKDISIPFTLKYDLKNPNLFGFIKFDWNFQNK